MTVPVCSIRPSASTPSCHTDRNNFTARSRQSCHWICDMLAARLCMLTQMLTSDWVDRGDKKGDAAHTFTSLSTFTK